MTKADLVDKLHKKTGITKDEASACLETVLETIKKTLEDCETVKIAGFGIFSVRKKKSRKGRNPRTGEAVSVDAKRVPYFKPGKEMRERLNLKEVTAE